MGDTPLLREQPEPVLSRRTVRRTIGRLLRSIGALIRVPNGQFVTPLPHVRAFADALSVTTGADSFGTYYGHSPTPDRALDIFVPVNSAVLGNAICDFALENLERFGVDYVIYRQHIYNPDVAEYWRLMEDRGDNTQNHFDHVHVSFEDSAPPPIPEPKPVPNIKELPMEFTYITPPEKKGEPDEDWIWLGAERIHARTGSGKTLEALKAAGQIKALGKVDREVHTYLRSLASNADFTG